MASGDGDYEVRWGFLRANSDPDGPARFKVRGDHVSAVIPSTSSVEMERIPEGELVGGMVTPKGYTFIVRARKLQGQYPKS